MRNRASAMSGGVSPTQHASAESGADRAADERRRQVDAVEPSARFWVERENGPIAEDEIGLHPEVNRNGGSDKKRQRDARALGDEDRPEQRERNEGDRGAGRRPAPAAIGDPAADRRGNGSRNAGEREKRDAILGQAIVRPSQQQGGRRPKQAEGEEEAALIEGSPTQDRRPP